MLIIRSNEGKMNLTAIGGTTELCAETATVIREIANQLIKPHEGTAQKLVVLKLLSAAIGYALEDVKKGVEA